METANDPGAREALASGRVPLFCDTALAGRIERAEAQLITRCCEAARRRTGTEGFVIPVAGGVASFAGEGSPFNKVAGRGFAGLPARPRSMTSRRPSSPAVPRAGRARPPG